MNYDDQILKEKIMLRVRFIHNVKAVGRLLLARVALLATLVAAAGFFVSIPNVLKNMPSILDVSNVARFSLTAFLNTKLAIQIIAIGTIVLLFYIARDIVKAFQGVSRSVLTA